MTRKIDAQAGVAQSTTVAAPPIESRLSPQQAFELLDRMADGLVTLDERNCIVYANPSACRIGACTREQLAGRRPREAFAGSFGERLETECRRAQEQSLTIRFEAQVEQAGDRWFEVQVAPAPGGVSVHMHDITAQQRLQEALRASEARFKAAFDQVPMALTVTSIETSRLLDVNEGFLQLSGYTREEVIGRTPDELGLWVDPALRTARFQMLRAGLRPPLIEARFRGKSGEEQSGLIASNLIELDGQPCVLSCNVDITERRHAEQALQEANRRKDEFLASLAHELRNPLAPLSNGLQIMRLAPQDAAVVEQARAMMERQLGQLVRLVDDLLDVSRFSRGRIELRRAPVELAAVVDGAVEICNDAIRAAGLTLSINLPAQPVPLDADKVRLVQVLSNLLNNAAKFTPSGGRIALVAERQGGEIIIRVTDTGCGIPPDMLENVFDLFVQADRSLERAQVGLGIGLTIVRRLVELHGGRVEAYSEGPGQGSEFVVWLPVAATPARTDSAAELALDAAPARRILLVDDNRDAANSLALALRLLQNEVRVAHDGLEALGIGEAFRPEVVLLDIGMPVLNGYDTARQMRERPWGRSAVLVALTGFGQARDRIRSLHAGFDHHLVKPADMAALQTIFRRISPGTAAQKG